ncbi:hypothetical protein LTR84_001767 [Exophiala bonariae]|uniref:DUF6594 domain-containing protein n=1 Tax=Exophiala bonariae TaxID=1690606 RepID=A0AAV9NBB1_9EURO|nr:hypothetical protein LTR84_001767 [Exophiala bonariae]
MATVQEAETPGDDRGYDSLARLMSDHPDNTIFRQFRALCSKMLMYRQADLLYDEEDLEFLSEENEKKQEKKSFNHCWNDISVKAEAATFREKIDDVQRKLKSYYELLALTATIENLPRPNNLSLAFLQEWVKSQDRGEGFLLDTERQIWESAPADDFVVLSPKATNDRLAVALNAFIQPLYHAHIGARRLPTAKRHGRVWSYDFQQFVLLGNILCILLATGIPAGSIVILYLVCSMWLRLLIIAIFCLLFAFVLTFIGGARRVDVFSATAAFAAVQAVFVGGTTLVQVRE